MHTIAASFEKEMDAIIAAVEVATAAVDLAKRDLRGLRSSHPAIQSLRKLHAAGNSSSLYSAVFFDGAYLTTCAQLEMAIRELLEKFIARVSTKISLYSSLPKEIRDWHPIGCAKIITEIKQKRFGHLTVDVIVANLASCVSSSVSKPYRLTLDAFSFNDVNFWPKEVESCLAERIGLLKVWQKLARDAIFVGHLGVPLSNPQMAENVARAKLETIMERRNHIIHRGKTYYTASETETKDCATYSKAFIRALAVIMETHLAAL